MHLYCSIKIRSSDPKANENWQGQEQSSEIWNEMGFQYLHLYTLGFQHYSNITDPEQNYSLYFVLQFLCLSLCKFASVCGQKLKAYTHYLYQGCQRLLAKRWIPLTRNVPLSLYITAPLPTVVRTGSEAESTDILIPLFHSADWSAFIEKHVHNNPTRPLPHLFAMKELISVTQIWRPILNLLKIAF